MIEQTKLPITVKRKCDFCEKITTGRSGFRNMLWICDDCVLKQGGKLSKTSVSSVRKIADDYYKKKQMEE